MLPTIPYINVLATAHLLVLLALPGVVPPAGE
jgi:hypothetical protein